MSGASNRDDIRIILLDVMLRVPPLFVMDGILTVANDALVLKYLGLPCDGMAWMILWGFLFAIGFIISAVVVTLGTIYLVLLYNHLLFLVVILLSQWKNSGFVASLVSSDHSKESFYRDWMTNASKITGNVVIQVSCAVACNTLREARFTQVEKYTRLIKPTLDSLTFISFLLPTACQMFGLSNESLKVSLPVSVTVPFVEVLLYTVLSLQAVCSFIVRMFKLAEHVIKTFGIPTFLEIQWKRLHVSNVLKTFWTILMVVYAVFYTSEILEQEDSCGENCLSFLEIVNTTLSKLLIRSSETVIALLGLTSIIAFFMHLLGIALAMFVGSTNDEDKSMGTVSAVLFFILSLQTGLTSLVPDKRLLRLYKNFCLLSTAVLHFTHGMVNPILEQLSAMGYQSPRKHARVLFVCACLVLLPCCFVLWLWSHHEISTWLLAVTAFSIEVMVKVFVSLIVYTMFMVDTHTEGYWEKLDDYIYFVKGGGACVEFIFGIFLFCNGGYIMLFESGGMIRAIMMCIHAYFNIWVQAKEGWLKFQRRRTAVHKISLLPELTHEQLVECGKDTELCAICFHELNVARVTQCRHYFHSNCLRKWLYQQDKCPLCHQQISLGEDKDTIRNSIHQHQD